MSLKWSAPAINREEGTTLAFSTADASKILDNPKDDTIEGLRDRAILSVGLPLGLRRGNRIPDRG